jgi:TolB-like protein
MFFSLKRLSKPALYFILCILAASFTSSAQKSIALADLAAQGVDPSASSIISDRLRNDLFATGRFTVIERSQMEQILNEQGFQQKGCTSDACAVEVGQLLGVQYIALGSVGLLGKTYTINVRMIDVRTGKIIRTAAEDCKCEIDDLLKKSVPKIARQLSQSELETKPESPRPETSQKVDQGKTGPVKTEPVVLQSSGSTGKSAKNRLVPRILAGILAVGAAGAGLYYNSVMTSETSQRTDLYNAYKNSGGSAAGAMDLKQSQDHGDKAKTASSNRDNSYIIAGLGAVGFVLTFVF